MTSRIPVLRLPNTRDLGGHRTAGGQRVKRGLVFRGAAPTDAKYVRPLTSLEIGMVFDLRTVGERDGRPDVLPPSAELIVADVLGDDPESGPASLGKIAQLALGGRTGAADIADLREAFRAGYRAFVSLGSARRAARDFLTSVADPASPPILVHCTAGKDRTGWLAALLLMCLETPWEAIVVDYLASAEPVWQMFEPYRDLFLKQGGNLEAIRIALGVFPEYLESARDHVLADFGSLDGYLTEGLGLPKAFRRGLAERMLDGARA